MASTFPVLASEEGAPEGIELFLPPLNEIVWSAIFFGIILFLFWKYVLPQMKTALDARTEGIEKKLEKAEADRAEAQTLLESYRAQLLESREEAATIRAKAQSDRQKIVAEAVAEARQAALVETERSHAQLEADVQRVRSELTREVGTLATTLAGKIVGEQLDDERANTTVDRFLEDLEATAGSGRG